MGVLLGVLKIRRGLASHSVAVGVWVTQGSHTGEKHMIFRNPSVKWPQGRRGAGGRAAKGEGESEEEAGSPGVRWSAIEMHSRARGSGWREGTTTRVLTADGQVSVNCMCVQGWVTVWG